MPLGDCGVGGGGSFPLIIQRGETGILFKVDRKMACRIEAQLLCYSADVLSGQQELFCLVDAQHGVVLQWAESGKMFKRLKNA